MRKNSYILLSDYAKSEGISLDEARERLNKGENKKFLKVANGKEMISTEIYKQQAVITDDFAVSTPKAEEEEAIPDSDSSGQEEIERLRKEIEELKAQIISKDNQIAEYTLRFADLAQQAQLIAGQAQILQAKEQTQKKLLDNPTDNSERKKGFFSKLFRR